MASFTASRWLPRQTALLQKLYQLTCEELYKFLRSAAIGKLNPLPLTWFLPIILKAPHLRTANDMQRVVIHKNVFDLVGHSLSIHHYLEYCTSRGNRPHQHPLEASEKGGLSFYHCRG